MLSTSGNIIMASFCVTLFDTIENPSDGDACFPTDIQNLTLNKNSSYKIVFKLSKNTSLVNFDGYSFRGNIKPSVNSTETLLYMSTANLLLQTNNNDSTLTMNLKESFMRRINVPFAYYDIDIINSLGNSSKIITGLITFI